MEPELSRLCLLELLMTSSVPLMQFLFDLILAPASRELARSWYLKLSPARISSAAEPTYFQRFPAILGIATRWGVVQSVGHLTVNEDGGGSNPPAPASFSRGNQNQTSCQPLAVGNPADTQPFQPPSMDSTLE